MNNRNLYDSSIYEGIEKRRKAFGKKIDFSKKIGNWFSNLFAGIGLVLLILLSLIPCTVAILTLVALIKYLFG